MALHIRKFIHRGLFNNYKRGLRRISLSTKLEKSLYNLEKNPYYEKYENKIAASQKTSPEEFMERVQLQQKAKEEEQRKKFASVDTRQFSSVLNPKESRKQDAGEKDKCLDDIFKTELVKDKDASEIQIVWDEYHKNKEMISATIPLEIYHQVKEQMLLYPGFIFPLPRSQGYEFIMSQIQGHTVHFTPLLAFQVHKENAPECLTIVHYHELSEKGIVLMRGEYDKNVLNGQEAQCLANQFQMYYDGKDKAKLGLLKNFNQSPDTFKHMDLIAQLENIYKIKLVQSTNFLLLKHWYN